MGINVMMKIYSAYICKEIREQRLQLMLVTLLIPTSFMIICLCADGLKVTSPVFVEKVSIVCLAVALSAFGVDIIGNETRKGKVHFLNRMPVGLGPSIATKLISFTACVLLCFLVGTLISYLINLAFGQMEMFELSAAFIYRGNLIERLSFEGTLPYMISFLVTASLILIAISCWIKKIGLCLAIWMLYMVFNKFLSDWLFNYHISGSAESMWRIAPENLLWVNPLLAFVIVCIAYVEGYRYSDGSVKAKVIGLSMMIVPLSFTLSQLLEYCGTNELFYYW